VRLSLYTRVIYIYVYIALGFFPSLHDHNVRYTYVLGNVFQASWIASIRCDFLLAMNNKKKVHFKYVCGTNCLWDNDTIRWHGCSALFTSTMSYIIYCAVHSVQMLFSINVVRLLYVKGHTALQTPQLFLTHTHRRPKQHWFLMLKSELNGFWHRFIVLPWQFLPTFIFELTII